MDHIVIQIRVTRDERYNKQKVRTKSGFEKILFAKHESQMHVPRTK